MSSALNWRPVTELRLNDKLIPNPNAEHELLNVLRNIRVAIEEGFLHIDPRRQSDSSTGGEFNVFIVPAASVVAITYRDADKKSGRIAAF